jgi:polyprenyl-phospho-N-acetylgalactosaminyl synthase
MSRAAQPTAIGPPGGSQPRQLGVWATCLNSKIMADLNDTFVVVPAFNEGRVIHGVIAGLCSVFQNVVVVNDGSSDDTAAALRSVPAVVINHAINLGQGAALQTGITYALSRGADYIVTFDADGQHRVEDALAAVGEIKSKQCDVVCGSRFLSEAAVNMPPRRRAVLKAAVCISNMTMRTHLTDAHNGLRVLNRQAAGCLDISQSGMAHASEIISQLTQNGMVIREIPIQVHYTDYSLSKGQSSSNAINIALDLIIGKFLK